MNIPAKRPRWGALIAATLGLLASVAAPASAAAKTSTLQSVRARGYVNCAIHTGQAGMSYLDKQGRWRGLFADYCRALAAATLGDASKVRFLPVSSNKRFTILQTGEADVLSRTTTWTLTRDVGLGINFTGVLYYDGQSFLVPRAGGVRAVGGLNGATICVTKGTTAELGTTDYFARKGLRYRPLAFESAEEAKVAFFAGRCDAMTTDAYTLAIIRLADAERPADYMVLPGFISKAPQSPAVRSDDEQWFDINKWLVNTLIAAEEYGVTSGNVDQVRRTTTDPELKRLLGVTPGVGKSMGLSEDWAYRAIKAVGNYGELHAKYIQPLGVERGMNRLYTEGGLLYPLPLR